MNVFFQTQNIRLFERVADGRRIDQTFNDFEFDVTPFDRILRRAIEQIFDESEKKE